MYRCITDNQRRTKQEQKESLREKMFQVYRMHIRNRIKSNTKITRKEGERGKGSDAWRRGEIKVTEFDFNRW